MKNRAKLVKESLYESQFDITEEKAREISKPIEDEIERRTNINVEFLEHQPGEPEIEDEPFLIAYKVSGGEFSNVPEEALDVVSLMIIIDEDSFQPESFYFGFDAAPLPVRSMHTKEEAEWMGRGLIPKPLPFESLSQKVIKEVVDEIRDRMKDMAYYSDLL